MTNRYIRQTMFAGIGPDGQRRLSDARVLLVGCGALGSAVADLLVRAGVGHLTVVDRDYVELHNLQRQSLFDESDVLKQTPKAVAAAARLNAVNSSVEIVPVIADFNAANAEDLASQTTIIVDGTDNFETRYLINDVAIKLGVPWVYGGVLSTYGMSMTIRPGVTACLRCIFPDSPEPGTAPTCESAGVLGPAVQVVASIQAAEALKLGVGAIDSTNGGLLSIDIWNLRMDTVPLGGPRADCPACQRHQYAYLDRDTTQQMTVLCGHDAVQVLPPAGLNVDLTALGRRLRAIGTVTGNRFLLRFEDAETECSLTVFPDGRAIVQGTTDAGRARSIYARYVGQ